MEERYRRQLILPEIGESGQRKLQNARILIIGAGGLGSAIAYALAGAGVGHLGIMDADEVEWSNLNRQTLHNPTRIGENKVLSAKKSIAAWNPDIDVTAYPYRFTAENAGTILRDYDFVLDAVDKTETKFLINDCCVAHGMAFCHGGAVGFSGQVLTYIPKKGPCLRCLFSAVAPSTQVNGIFGATAGIVGNFQALEAIKFITGAGECLVGRFLAIDGLAMQIRVFPFEKNPDCPICGKI